VPAVDCFLFGLSVKVLCKFYLCVRRRRCMVS